MPPPSPQSNDILFPEPKSSGSGPIVGTIIIVLLMIFGGFYFWGAHLNKTTPEDQLPLIPDNTSQAR